MPRVFKEKKIMYVLNYVYILYLEHEIYHSVTKSPPHHELQREIVHSLNTLFVVTWGCSVTSYHVTRDVVPRD